ncbi:MAG: alpha-amylase [Cyclobacteriaceae bacterium]
MMRIPHSVQIIGVLVWLFSCAPQNESTQMLDPDELPVRWPNAVTYEIFVQSFADSNGDGIGDIKGMTLKLDYLQDLGIENIWLMPINPSPSYHKYDVTDYYGIHPSYGTMDDFKEFLQEAHKRDIRVTMDLVINHCSNQHQWFQDALDPSNEYRDYFVWKTMEEIEAEGILEKEKTGDSDNIKQWNKLPGQKELYFSFFYSGMPDLNYDNPKVREGVYKIGEYWLQEIGVDGFRMDAAKHIYPDNRAEDNHAFWQEFKSTMQAIKPDVYIVGEVWSDLEVQTPFAQGFDALFNFDMSFSMLETVKNKRVVSAAIHESAWKINEGSSPTELYNESESAFKSYNPNFINTTFLTNHDQNRVMSFLNDNEEQAKLAASILLTLPGSPYIYYGEELGMRGMKPDPLIREPYLWDKEESDTIRTSWIKAVYNTDSTLVPLAQQIEDPTSMYHHYRKLIRLRRASEVLTYGDLMTADVNDEEILAFTRSFEGEKYLIIHNLSESEKVLPIIEFSTIIYQNTTTSVFNNNQILLPPYKSLILSQPKNQ